MASPRCPRRAGEDPHPTRGCAGSGAPRARPPAPSAPPHAPDRVPLAPDRGPRRGHRARRGAPRARPRADRKWTSRDRGARRSMDGLRFQQAGRVIRRDASLGELPQDLLAPLGLAVGLGLRREPERADDRVEPRADRGIRDAELALDVLEAAPCADEYLEEFELLRRESVEATERERAFEPRSAALAFQPHDVELLRADRASRDDRIRHDSVMRGDLIESQADMRVL